MKILQQIGIDGIATVYVAETERGRIEFVESVEPPFPRDEKWVMIVSSLYGCPIECLMCDAGGNYKGCLTEDEILSEIEYMVCRRYPDRSVPARKFKIQFARVGEPSLNRGVLRVLERLPSLYNAPGLMPALSTVAPIASSGFFDALLQIKKRLYPENFQLQFSIHSSSEAERDKIIPVAKWPLEEIASYGSRFYTPGGRKITLNFALRGDSTIDPEVIRDIFSPDTFFIKMTPLNPTFRAFENGLESGTENGDKIAEALTGFGFDVLVSIGEPAENLIGSNCGQYIRAFEENLKKGRTLSNGYQKELIWKN